MLRKFVGVGLHSSPGEGARAVMMGFMKINHRLHRFTQIIKKNTKKSA